MVHNEAAPLPGAQNVPPNLKAEGPKTTGHSSGSAPSDAKDQPGLEVVTSNGQEKEVVQADKEVVHTAAAFDSGEKQVSEPFIHPDAPPTRSYEQPRHPRVCGLKRGIFWGILVAALVFVLGLAIGLGVGLSKDESEEPDAPSTSSTTTQAPVQPSAAPIDDSLKIGGALSDRFFSNEGVWNGTGIATNWQRFASNFEDATAGDNQVVYYQHFSGAIRWMRKTNSGEWVRGPSDSEIVAEDAKNSTPIAAVHLNVAGEKLWHIFYIDQENRIRQRSGSNSSSSWTDGSINDANLMAYRGDLVGLHACWAGIGNSAPIRLWYASDNTTFEEYLFQDDEWRWQQSWDNYNGAAGVGCYSWSTGDHIYAAFVNTNDDVELWYQNPTSAEPAWRQTDVVIPDVHPASSISLSMFVCVVQKHNPNELQVSQMTWSGENTTREYDRSFSLEGGADSVGGTRLTTYSRSNGTGGNDVFIFNQMHGDDLTELKRGLEDLDGTWSENNIATRN